MKVGKQKLRQGVYLTGLALESTNRVASILGKHEPIKHGLIYQIYKLGRWLK